MRTDENMSPESKKASSTDSFCNNFPNCFKKQAPGLPNDSALDSQYSLSRVCLQVNISAKINLEDETLVTMARQASASPPLARSRHSRDDILSTGREDKSGSLVKSSMKGVFSESRRSSCFCLSTLSRLIVCSNASSLTGRKPPLLRMSRNTYTSELLPSY